MNTSRDIAIIGGGLVGCSAALHARRRNASVVLFERGTVGAQASGVNYGGVRQQGRHLAELPLARRSRALWVQLPDLIGTDGEFVATGHLKLARSHQEAAELEAYARAAKPFGLDLELIDRAGIRALYPWLSGGVVAGSFCAEDGHANPRLVAPAVARRARALGADIREHTAIAHARLDGEAFEIATSDGETCQARHLINAAGAWGSQIAGMFDEPVPETVMAPNMCVTEPLPYFIKPNIGVCGGAIYLRQIERGNVIFGAGLGSGDRDAVRATSDPAVTHAAAKAVIELVPSLRHALLIRTWSGIEGRLPDMLPVVGPSATTPGLIHGFGFSGHGFQLSLAVGAVLVELALDGETPTEISGLAIDRFRISQITRRHDRPAAMQENLAAGRE